MLTPRKSVARSFAHALEGVMFVFSTQKHMQIHCVIISLVLLAAVGLQVSLSSLLFLLFAMALVLVTEMLNTAVESSIDIYVQSYSPPAKVAKDVSAGAVLISSVFSVIVGFAVFLTDSNLVSIIRNLPKHGPRPEMDPVRFTILGIILLAMLVILFKERARRGTILRGGPVSGHSALGFFLGACIFFFTGNLAVTALAGAMALLIAQSRVQADIHSVREVVLGGVLGVVVAAVAYWPSG